jgi:transposase
MQPYPRKYVKYTGFCPNTEFWRDQCLRSISYDGPLAEANRVVGGTDKLRQRIPPDHLLRKINKVLDLGFVRREVAGSYGSNGHVSVDPVIIIKLMLLLFLDDVRSERELMRIVRTGTDNGTDLCFWLARDAREFSESRPVFPSTNNLESFHYLIYTHAT